jgi:hypothetical protein
MNKITLALSSATILSLGVTACHKNNTQTAVTNATHSPVHSTAAKGTGYSREAMIIEGSGHVDCTQKGNSCKVKLVAQTDPEVQEIAILQQIIAQNGNGNAYFSTTNWSVLFDDDDPQTLLGRISANQVFLYQLTSASNSGTTYGY